MTNPDRATEWEVQSATTLHLTDETGPSDDEPYAQRQSPDECHHERHIDAATCGKPLSTVTTPPQHSTVLATIPLHVDSHPQQHLVAWHTHVLAASPTPAGLYCPPHARRSAAPTNPQPYVPPRAPHHFIPTLLHALTLLSALTPQTVPTAPMQPPHTLGCTRARHHSHVTVSHDTPPTSTTCSCSGFLSTIHSPSGPPLRTDHKPYHKYTCMLSLAPLMPTPTCTRAVLHVNVELENG
ncbi:hypothetical protein K439DRAFT_1656767 [Ramaria rubella]|nr:hypothetical protein K439DRAFT_1656767 [Ramaria rubella]